MVLIGGMEDLTFAFITTNIKEENAGDLLLRVNSQNGLKKNSILKLSKIATLDFDLVTGKIGKLTESELKAVDQKLIEILKIKI